MRRIALASALAVVAVVVGAEPASAGIISETSSNPSIASVGAVPDYTGANFSFPNASPPGLYPAAAITDTLLKGGATTLTFNYDGFDFGPDGLRPVLNLVNDTGATVTGLTYTIASPTSANYYGFYGLGTVVVSTSPAGAVFTFTQSGSDAGLSVTIPLTLAPGAVEALYLPIENLDAGSTSYTLQQTSTSMAVPEPSSFTIAASALLATVGWMVWQRRRPEESGGEKVEVR